MRLLILVSIFSFIYCSEFINLKNSSLLLNSRHNSYGITKIGPCTAQLDDGKLFDLSELGFI